MNKKSGENRINSYFDWLDSLVFALTAVIVIFTFVLKSYIVDGSSMVPTLEGGDRIYALDLMYTPKSGDIVILDDNNSYGKPLVKRVAAVGGQTIDISEAGEITIDGEPFASPVASGEYNLLGDTSYPFTVPDGYVFVMGDNRAGSFDSRYSSLGVIDERCVLGREIARLG